MLLWHVDFVGNPGSSCFQIYPPMSKGSRYLPALADIPVLSMLLLPGSRVIMS